MKNVTGVVPSMAFVAMLVTVSTAWAGDAAFAPGGLEGDDQTSIVYDPATGEIRIDAPNGVNLTSINISSAGSVFMGDPAMNLDGSFDIDEDDTIFKATFGSSFGTLSFGNVAKTELSADFVLNDLTIDGALEPGGGLGDVDLIYVPEPSSILLLTFGLMGILRLTRRKGR